MSLFTLELIQPGLVLEIESDVEITFDQYKAVASLILLLNSSVEGGLTNLSLVFNIGDSYNYVWNTNDGRTFSQVLVVTESSAKVNFSVVDFFELAEFKPHRDIRDSLISLIQNQQLLKLEATL